MIYILLYIQEIGITIKTTTGNIDIQTVYYVHIDTIKNSRQP